jgi:DNA-binding NtrC family response regulator
MQQVLVVDDDKVLQDNIKQVLEYHRFIVDVADNGREALDKILKKKFDLVVMDVNMPEMDGFTALKEIKHYDPSITVLILTAYSNVTDAVSAVKEGAYNYLEKPINSEKLVALIKRALKAKTLVETSAFSAPSFSLGHEKNQDRFVGESDVMKKVFGIISKLAQVSTPVLIRGESGTGKELVARAIHYNGPRKDEKFISINLAAIPETLIESELFGHEKGAFTGAVERKLGKFQYANGGTLFLDEIGDIGPAMQIKLLRVLQEKSFSPVGSNRTVKVDVRVIAASHKPFEEMIKNGQFREDLFYRLNVLPVFLPPLRARAADIPHLVSYYIKYFNLMHGLNITSATPEAMEILKKYSWPGNIRELRNVIEHAFIMETSDKIEISSFPDSLKKEARKFLGKRGDESDLGVDFTQIQNSILDEDVSKGGEGYSFSFGSHKSNGETRLDFQEAKDLFEKEFIIQALILNWGKINKTALKANIPKKTLLRKIEKYGINPKDYYR